MKSSANLARAGCTSLGLFFLVVSLTGCGVDDKTMLLATVGAQVNGTVHGGQQPVAVSKVYVYAVGTGGYGGYGIAPSSANASVSLMNSATPYVTTDAAGNFSLTGTFSCTAAGYDGTEQVYLYASGGNPGSGTNSYVGLMAGLGACNSLTSSTRVIINEITTVATTYALAGYASDATHISNSGTTQAANYTKTAFATIGNLVNTGAGAVASATAGNNGTIPAAQIITLANILGACINSTGSSSGGTPCGTLLSDAPSDDRTLPTQPTDTASAAINLAHTPNPGSASISALFGIIPSSPAFSGGLTSAPGDFLLPVTYSGGGLNTPLFIAMDSGNNPFVLNGGSPASLSHFSNLGVTEAGYPLTGGGMNVPSALALDPSGNVWVTNYAGNSLSEFDCCGHAITSSSGYSLVNNAQPEGLALDSTGNVYVSAFGTSQVMKVNGANSASTGSAISAFNGTSGSYSGPFGIALSASGNAWVTDDSGPSLSVVSGSTGALQTTPTGGGLSGPTQIAFDNSGNAWVAGAFSTTLSKFTSAGAAVSASGYQNGFINTATGLALDGAGNVWLSANGSNAILEYNHNGVPMHPLTTGFKSGNLNGPNGMAIDGCGNVWIVNSNGNTLTEFVGAGTPVVTPLSANLVSPYNAPASRP